MSSRLQPPEFLESYRTSVLHTKMSFVHSLLKWASAWLDEVQDMSPEAAFDGLAHAKKIRRTAWGLEKTFEEAALAEMFHAGMPIHEGDGYTAVMRPGGSRKGWKNQEVMTALVDKTYERMLEHYPAIPEKMLRSILEESMWSIYKAGRIEWRSTELRRAGLEPNLYSTKEEEAPTIDLRGPASYVDPKTGKRAWGGRAAPRRQKG